MSRGWSTATRPEKAEWAFWADASPYHKAWFQRVGDAFYVHVKSISSADEELE
jgi:hypothetical protein